MAAPKSSTLPLDELGKIRWVVEDKDGQAVSCIVIPEGLQKAWQIRLLKQLAVDDSETVSGFRRKDRTTGFAKECNGGRTLNLLLNGRLFAQYGPERGFVAPTMPITAAECRLLGEQPGFSFFPREGGAPAYRPVSDFHTHSSGELPGRDVVAIAERARVPYPVRLLRILGIGEEDLPAERTRTDRIPFPPLAKQEAGLPNVEEAVFLHHLASGTKARLASAMDAPIDRQSTLNVMEKQLYRFRTPLTKSPEVILPTLMKIGENYRRSGIRYAEITMTGLDRPELLKAVHDAVPKVKAEHGVDLRFLVAIPRTEPEPRLRTLFNRLPVLMESPYVIGPDVIGYETNKTSQLMHHLESFAEWAMTSGHDEATIRAHAGENGKNPDNVIQILKLAERTGIRVRAGHAIYGLTDEALDLMARLEGRAVVEFNPASNIALHNIDLVTDIPFRRCETRGLPFVASKDGAGIMTATSLELAFLLRNAGMTDAEFERMQRTETALIAEQLSYGATKAARVTLKHPAFHDDPADFVASLSEHLREVLEPPTESPPGHAHAVVEPRWQGGARKTRKLVPIVLVGASGTSWRKVEPSQQKEAAVAVDMLVNALDPDEVRFVQGRPKLSGVTGLLGDALRDLGQGDAKNTKFRTLAMVNGDEMPAAEQRKIAPHFTDFESIGGSRLDIGDALADIARPDPEVGQAPGIFIAIGGVEFTRSAILAASHNEVPLYVFGNVAGASAEKARVLDPESVVNGAKDLMTRLSLARPELLAAPLDAAEIDRRYLASAARVERRPLPGLEPLSQSDPGRVR